MPLLTLGAFLLKLQKGTKVRFKHPSRWQDDASIDPTVFLNEVDITQVYIIEHLDHEDDQYRTCLVSGSSFIHLAEHVEIVNTLPDNLFTL